MRHKTGRYDHLVGYALEHPWAITPSMLAMIAGLLASRMAGEDPDPAAIARAEELRAAREYAVSTGGTVRVIPMYGVIAPRMNLFSEMSGGTTFDALTSQLTAAVNDPNVKAIVFDVDSPGGNVAGATEFAREVLRARTVKPIYAQAQHLMASAAYHPMACATEVIGSPSSMTGAIGVYTIYDDLTAALDQLGIKREVFTAGKFKAEGVGGTGLTDEAREHIKSLIDGAYSRMIGDIAKGRGVSAADVRTGFGEGRVLGAEEAKAARLIDRIATLQETLARATQAAASQAGGVRGTVDAPPAATDQEPTSATSQEPRAVHDDDIVGFEQRVLALSTKGL